jgi:hypothetical protein
VGSFFVYILFPITLLDSKPSPTAAHHATWTAAIVLEVVLFALSFANYMYTHKEPTASHHRTKLRFQMIDWEAVEMAMDLLRIILLLALIGLYDVFVILPQRRCTEKAGSSNESTTPIALTKTPVQRVAM